MAKKIQKRSFDDVLSALGTQHFDVAPAHDGATRRSGVMRCESKTVVRRKLRTALAGR